MSLEEHKAFLESLDGKPRDVKLLEKLMTPQGRLDFAVYQVFKSSPQGAHRYRALFDNDYRKRANPGLERLTELDEEFAKLTDQYHRQALIYYFGKTEEENLIIAMKEDKIEIERDVIERLKNMGGAPPEDNDEYNLGLEDWTEDQ